MSLSNASIVRLTHSRVFQQARQAIVQSAITDKAITIQQIAAPTFDEKERAQWVMEQFQTLGLNHIYMDDLYNVYGWLGDLDEHDRPTLLVSAHTDTVFSAETDLAITRQAKRLFGAGLGDNSLGVAALLTLIELFIQHDLPHSARICFVANSREEGLGNLDGIRQVGETLLSHRIKAAIVLEGMALGRIYHAGIAVRRLKISYTAQGGHSWLHFGNPSAVHVLMNFGSAMQKLHFPKDPQTTFNIGILEGGSSINTIAAQATCYVDLRSKDAQTLQEIETQVRHTATSVLPSDDVQVQIDVVGDRPNGVIPETHPLVRLAINAHEAINMVPELEEGSTDANALLHLGIPTVCVGISYGGNAHTLKEYIETEPIENGMWHLLLLVAASSNALSTW